MHILRKKLITKHIAWLLLIPFFFALIGISYGLPMHLVGDEESLIGGAMKMLELRNFVPATQPDTFAFFYYPPILGYLVIIVSAPVIAFKYITLGFSLTSVQHYFALDQNLIWYSARILTALTSVGLLAVLYAIAKQLYTRRVALLSTLVLATSFLHVVLSHWMRHWMYTTFFAYFTILLGILFVKKKKHIYAYAAAVVAGIGFGASYISVLGFGAVLVYWISQKSHLPTLWRTIIRTSILAAIIGGGIAALNLPELVRIISPVDGTLSHTKSIGDLLHFSGLFLSIILKQELVIALLTLMGMVVLWKKYKSLVLTTIVTIATYVLILYFLFHLEIRYVYPMIPLLALVSGLVIDRLITGVKNKKIAVIIIILILLWPTMSVLQYTYLLTQSDTREVARHWLIANVEADEGIVLSSESIILPRTQEALEREGHYGRLRASERYAKNNPEQISVSQKQFDVTNLHFWDDTMTLNDWESFVATQHPRYAVIEHHEYDAFSEYEQWIIEHGTIIRRFKQSPLEDMYDINGNFYTFNTVLFKLNRLGRTIDIYDLQPESNE